jgi:hypothetical protein
MKRHYKVISISLFLCLVFGMLAVHAAANFDLQGSNRIRDRVGEASARYKASLSGVVFAESYADVFSALRTLQATGYGGVKYNDGRGQAAAPAAEAALFGRFRLRRGGYPEARSTTRSTNVQVAGIDEGDIVKTDGTYIYVLHDLELIIYKADGAETGELSRTTVGQAWRESGDGKAGEEKYPFEIYVYGDRLAVLSTRYSAVVYSAAPAAETDRASMPAIWYPRSNGYLCVDIYDVSDAARPVLKSSLGQDGYNLASRMKDGLVYAVSNHYVYAEPMRTTQSPLSPASTETARRSPWPPVTSASCPGQTLRDIRL